jgi:COP9 signalosome complex subunit 4
VASESTPLVISRQVLQDFAVKLPELGTALNKEVAIYTLEKVQPRVVAFEEQIATIREDLSKIYEEEESWVEAAKTLIGIPLESQRFVV